MEPHPLAPHAASPLERLLLHSRATAERTISGLRIALLLTFLVRYLLIRFDSVLRLAPEALLIVAALLICLAASTVLFRLADSRRGAQSTLVAASVLDAGAALLPFVAVVVWPADDYPGLLRRPDFAIFLLTTIVSGARLSLPAVVVAIAANGLACLGLLLADLTLNAARVGWNFQDLVTWAVLFSGSAVAAITVTTRTRRLVYRGADAMVESERMRQRMGAYVSEEFEQMLDGDALTPTGRRMEVAVLFSDLRGFTRYAERLTPEQLVLELNAYLDAMVPAIRAEGGVIDKYIGDAIMVVFGVPRSRPDDAARAVRTAAKMQEALARHNAERAARGLPPLAQGIGIDFGPAVAGSIGTRERLQLTVVGDVVNCASRLESSTKEQGVPVLVSGAAAKAVGGVGPALRALGALRLKGREGEIEAFTLA